MSEMLELAKRIAERAGKNAKVAPELLYAPILWELQDDARSSADSEHPVAWRYTCQDGSQVLMLKPLTSEQKRRGYYIGEDGEDEVGGDDAIIGPFHWAQETPLYAAPQPARTEPQGSAGSGEEWNPADEQVRSAATWYRHDLGLLTVAEAAKVKTEARLWLRAWQKEVAALRTEPQTAPVRDEIAKVAFNLAEAVECSVDLDLHPLLKKRVEATKSALKSQHSQADSSPQSLPTREEIAKAIGVALYGEDTFRSPDLNGWNLSAVLPAADATIALFARSQAVIAPALDAATVEACAKFIEQHQETIREAATGTERYLAPRKVGNLMGVAYVDGLRALTRPMLSPTDKANGSQS